MQENTISHNYFFGKCLKKSPDRVYKVSKETKTVPIVDHKLK